MEYRHITIPIRERIMKSLITLSSALFGIIVNSKADQYVGRAAQDPSTRDQISEEEYEALVGAELMEVTDHWCGRMYSAKRISARAEAAA